MHSLRFMGRRCLGMGLIKLLLSLFARFPVAAGIPVISPLLNAKDGEPSDEPSFWLYLGVATALVVTGGAFAGLTIALMGQDEIYLQVIKTSGEGPEKRHAEKVLNLLKKGKHWVLVTLLLSNVITNETLPIVLDRSLGGGWPAVLGSTALIVVFGEVVPQSICVRYGLPIGAWMSPCVLALMYIMSPVAWPIAKLLDRLLGADHRTLYKKAGLKTLVTLHKTLGSAGEQLNSDEVTIISAVLDLKEKAVGSIMIPMEDVFTMSTDTVLDEQMMDLILSQGYSRIPIHSPDNPQNFVGMLLVKMLITYDPEDGKQVRDFALATLPETRAETSCLDIVNFFQEGKSHMVLVSEFPGEDHGALGVVTLEDVIEELIGEEIIDESDVFIDVHKAIRRMAPAPKARVPKGRIVTDPFDELTAQQKADVEGLIDKQKNAESSSAKTGDLQSSQQKSSVPDVGSPPPPIFKLRRAPTQDATERAEAIIQRGATPEIREHLKHLGPSNLASRPRQTRYNNVKIKPGTTSSPLVQTETESRVETPDVHPTSESTSLLGATASSSGVRSAGKTASDGVQALRAYGTAGDHTSQRGPASHSHDSQRNLLYRKAKGPSGQHSDVIYSDHSRSTSGNSSPKLPYLPRGPVRSGSITEQIVDSNGIRKVILQTSDSRSGVSDGERKKDRNGSSSGAEFSSSTIPGKALKNSSAVENDDAENDPEETSYTHASAKQDKKKKRRKKRKPATTHESGDVADDEGQPLLG
ncbi:cell agglutination protein Mam3 [Ophidiomyces ophidiicola]|nr:cell agglutination protein Mam3 [Ophidiomyces ophidiicola]KAI2308984.1 cell agglutination protein Mam3 [Ophidiomyces ophidiicola]KAI2402195.1 cell agglutination protein Mam3 [Ophidiomyces ophidiicola]KAI2406186.1 cell agglutination protein Mam3 [Ophidiomyces ophidiicola]